VVRQLIYKLPVTIKLYDREYIARCELLRATATGDTSDEALKNLSESIDEMIKEFGREVVFQDISPETEVRVLEVSV
jgi:predicted RNase H-like HicB family nuclease